MKKLWGITVFVCILLSSCSPKKEQYSDISKSFYDTLDTDNRNINNIREYEVSILECFFDNNLDAVQAGLQGIVDDSDLEKETTESASKLKKKGKYEGSIDKFLYSRDEAKNIYSNEKFSSEQIENYTDKDINKYNEIVKPLCNIEITYSVDRDNMKIVTQTFRIEDVKGEKYFISVRWEGVECVEISYKNYAYLW